MAFTDILVHLDGGRGQETRLRLAADLARSQQGLLIGVYGIEPLPLAGIAGPGIGSFAEIETMRIAAQQQRDTLQLMSDTVEGEFRAAVEKAGVASEWRTVEGQMEDLVTLHARYADLTVLGQVDPDDPPSGGMALIESVLNGSGRPVLIIPYAGRFETIGRKVLIAWNATKEAARAVGDALPLLRESEAVTVLSVDPSGGISGDGEEPAADLARRLARQGIKAEASTLVSDDVKIGDLLLSRAADLGSDLIVMGGYGHSPTREMLFGGATRELLQHMTVPVLMSH